LKVYVNYLNKEGVKLHLLESRGVAKHPTTQ